MRGDDSGTDDEDGLSFAASRGESGVASRRAAGNKLKARGLSPEARCEEVRKVKRRRRLEAVADVDFFECPICLDLLANPVVGSCGHDFCQHCLEQWVKQTKGAAKCPVCRRGLQQEVPGICRRIANQIEAIFPEESAKRKREAAEEQDRSRLAASTIEASERERTRQRMSSWQNSALQFRADLPEDLDSARRRLDRTASNVESYVEILRRLLEQSPNLNPARIARRQAAVAGSLAAQAGHVPPQQAPGQQRGSENPWQGIRLSPPGIFRTPDAHSPSLVRPVAHVTSSPLASFGFSPPQNQPAALGYPHIPQPQGINLASLPFVARMGALQTDARLHLAQGSSGTAGEGFPPMPPTEPLSSGARSLFRTDASSYSRLPAEPPSAGASTAGNTLDSGSLLGLPPPGQMQFTMGAHESEPALRNRARRPSIFHRPPPPLARRRTRPRAAS